jgi:DNA polymerase III subunit delta'
LAFGNVLGHDRVKEILARGLASGRLPPALLLAGPEGIGKRTLALALGRALLCDRDGGDGCGACSACRRIDKVIESLPELREHAASQPDEPAALNLRLHPDLVLVEPWRLTVEGKARIKPEIKIKQIRDVVQEIQSRPFEARVRLFVIEDAHQMNEEASNALLKSLEEPPPTSHLILVSSAPQNLLPTIRSRCQVLRMAPLPSGLLEGHLREKRGLSAEEARLRAAMAGGSLGAALAFASDSYRKLRAQALEILAQPAASLAMLEAAERLAQLEDELPLALIALRSVLRDVAALRAGAGRSQLLNLDLADELSPFARGPLGERAAELADRAGQTLVALRGNANRLLAADLLLDAFRTAR